MENDVEQLVSRIAIFRPPSGRVSRWPKEIKAECVRILNLGYPLGELSKRSCIWAGSLHDWQKKAKPKFKEVRLKDQVETKTSSGKDGKVFTLQFSTGPRIENVTLEDLQFFKGCGLI